MVAHKIKKNTFKNNHFWPFWSKHDHFWRLFLIFSETIPCQELGFFALRSVHQDASFELSKTAFGQFFIFFILRGDPFDLGGSKSYPTWKKRSEKISKFFSSNQDAKWNKKMSGRSFVITCGVIGTL